MEIVVWRRCIQGGKCLTSHLKSHSTSGNVPHSSLFHRSQKCRSVDVHWILSRTSGVRNLLFVYVHKRGKFHSIDDIRLTSQRLRHLTFQNFQRLCLFADVACQSIIFHRALWIYVCPSITMPGKTRN